MADQMHPWQMELGEYIRQGEPDRAKKAESWKTAIGLQQVDGLEVSDYLVDTAKMHIEGTIDTRGARERIESYYEERRERGIIESESEEADVVSQRIVEILGERAFQFSPAGLISIHRRLFEGLFGGAGLVRDYNITKKEWVLNGDTVLYAPAETILESLDYDFGQEREFSYEGLALEPVVRHLAGFISGIWQIHPFCEGNTRTTAVFLIQYLGLMGFRVSNDPFEKNSWFFRNALVRANYTNYELGITATLQPLVQFLENVMFGAHHVLRNRELHVDYPGSSIREAQSAIPKCNDSTLDCTLEQLSVLRELAMNSRVTQKQLAGLLGVSERTVKTRTVELQSKGLLRREGGRRNGHWVVSESVLGVLGL